MRISDWSSDVCSSDLHAHEHATQLADGLSDQDDAPGDLDPADTTVLHAHDVGTTVSTLPTLPTVMLSALVPVAPSVHLTTPPPPSSARTPPHRPPNACPTRPPIGWPALRCLSIHRRFAEYLRDRTDVR